MRKKGFGRDAIADFVEIGGGWWIARGVGGGQGRIVYMDIVTEEWEVKEVKEVREVKEWSAFAWGWWRSFG